MLEALVGAAIVAKLRKYRLRCCFRFRFTYILVGALLLLMGLQVLILSGFYGIVGWMQAGRLVLLPVFLASAFLARNELSAKHLAAVLSSCVLGAGLNQWVMAANGGNMPVHQSLSRLLGMDSFHAMGIKQNYLVAGDDTKLRFLGDILDVGYEIYSLGDLLMVGAASILLYCYIKRCNRGDRGLLE